MWRMERQPRGRSLTFRGADSWLRCWIQFREFEGFGVCQPACLPFGLSSPRGHCVSPVGGGALCTDPGPESWHAYAAGCSAHLLRGFFQVFPPGCCGTRLRIGHVAWSGMCLRAATFVGLGVGGQTCLQRVPSGSYICWAWSWRADLVCSMCLCAAGI